MAALSEEAAAGPGSSSSAGVVPLSTLHERRDALEIAMKAAFHLESFAEASRLQELLDDMDDAIHAAEAAED